jgi:hypothetical protein
MRVVCSGGWSPTACRRGGDELGASDLGGEVSLQEDVAGAEVMRLQVSQCAGDVDRRCQQRQRGLR